MERVFRGLVTTPWAQSLPADENPLLAPEHSKLLDVVWLTKGNLDEEALLRLIRTAGPFDFIIAGGLDKFTERVIAALAAHAGDVRPIVSRAGVGFENINLDAARIHNCAVAIAPGNHDAVAEHTIALLLMAMGELPGNTGYAQHGRWRRAEGRELIGSTCGLCGFGRIGQAVARRLATSGVNVLYYDPIPDYYKTVPGYDELLDLWRLIERQSCNTLMKVETLEGLFESLTPSAYTASYTAGMKG